MSAHAVRGSTSGPNNEGWRIAHRFGTLASTKPRQATVMRYILLAILIVVIVLVVKRAGKRG
jgi:hypothetical protein